MNTDSSLIRIYLLGKFEVVRAGQLLKAQEWKRRKAAYLLQRLAYERRLVKDQAIDFLWPESDLGSGSNNLYRVLFTLRQTLDTSLGPGAADEILSFEDGILHLQDSVWVDASEFEGLCRSIPGEPPEQRISRLEAALALYTGGFLPDERYEEWTLLPRDKLSQLHREASLNLAKHSLERRDFLAAFNLLVPLLAVDRADEPVHRELMRAYALSGRRHEALRQYQDCVDALATEFDIPPSAETTALYDKILRGELAPPAGPSLAVPWSPPAPVSLAAGQSERIAGRQAELNTISSLLQTIQKGRGHTLFIAGETGIGKTHLAMEALNLATRAEMTTLLGAAYELEGCLPLQPYIEAFDHYLARKSLFSLENPITHFHRSGYPDAQQDHWALFHATANFILGIARDSPLVFLIDDIHAADDTSLQLFHYLARQTRNDPVLLIATYRNDTPASAQFNALLGALDRERLSTTISLKSLPMKAVQEILEDVLHKTVKDALCQAVYDITAGNPYFTQEIARALHRQGKADQDYASWLPTSGDDLSVPDNLSALLRQKVRRQGESVELVLATAAVIGMEFGFEILRGAASLPNGEVLDALDAALAGHLIEETPGGYRFRHPLIRRTLFESLSRVRRAYQHTRTAETIEAIYAPRIGGLLQWIESLAYHYDLSDRRDRALPYLIQAGEKAASIYAFEVAIGYFERALSLMDDLGHSDPAQRWHLLETLGWWHNILADTPRAVACFEQALALEPKSDWRPTIQDIARLHRGAATVLITAGDMESAERHLHAALSVIGEGEDSTEYAYVLYNLAQLHWHRNEYQQALKVAQRSLAIAERLDEPGSIARAFEMLALVCHSLGEWQTGISYEQQRAELAGSGLDVTDAFDIHL